MIPNVLDVIFAKYITIPRRKKNWTKNNMFSWRNLIFNFRKRNILVEQIFFRSKKKTDHGEIETQSGSGRASLDWVGHWIAVHRADGEIEV